VHHDCIFATTLPNGVMDQERRRQELAAGLRKSRRALPYQVAIASVLLAAIWGVHSSIRVPVWIAWLTSVLAVFGTVGNAINILYCGRALRRLGGY
jgi:hypothetical protein